MATTTKLTAVGMALCLVTACKAGGLEEGAESLDTGESELEGLTGPTRSETNLEPIEDKDAWASGHMLEDPGANNPQAVTHAVAVLSPTKGNETTGTVRFVAKEDTRLQVTAEFHDLPPGEHGYHIHLYGDCSSPDAKSAGTHFNLEGSSKSPPEDIDRITGNLGEVTAGSDGHAKAQTMLESASLSGRYGVIGRAVIIHAKGNDESKPPIGAAGARLACGVIGAASGESGTQAKL